MEINDKHEQFINRLKAINENICVLGKYTRAKDKIQVKCLVCGNEWSPTANKLLCGRGCPHCADNIRKSKLRKSHSDFIDNVHNINSDITIMSEYVNSTTYVKCHCDKCNFMWDAKPYNLLSGKGCPNCAIIERANKCRKTNEDFILELSKINPKIKVFSKYKNNTTKLKCECLECGNKWNAAPKTLLIGKGCPICNSSKGEIKISDYLDNHNIPYVHQKSFEHLVGVGGNLLSYDFYLPNKNILIEYQGIQHEKPVDFKGFGMKYADKEFIKQKEHDKRKLEYAENNNIKLVCIWYWDYQNIDSILEKLIN